MIEALREALREDFDKNADDTGEAVIDAAGLVVLASSYGVELDMEESNQAIGSDTIFFLGQIRESNVVIVALPRCNRPKLFDCDI